MAIIFRDEEIEKRLTLDAGTQPVPITKTSLATYVLKRVCETAEAEKIDVATLVNRLARREPLRRPA